METEPVAEGVAAKWRAVKADIDHEQQVLASCRAQEVAARVDGQWLILDNVRVALVLDTEMIGSIPKFVLDKDGARRFASRGRAGQGPSAGQTSPAQFVRPA